MKKIFVALTIHLILLPVNVFSSSFNYAGKIQLTINSGDISSDGINLLIVENSIPDNVLVMNLIGQIIKDYSTLGGFTTGITFNPNDNSILFSGGQNYTGDIYKINILNGSISGPVTNAGFIQPYLAYDGSFILASADASGSNGVLTIPIKKIDAKTYSDSGTISVTVNTGTNASGVSRSIIASNNGYLYVALGIGGLQDVYEFDSNLNLVQTIKITQIVPGQGIGGITFVNDDLYVLNRSTEELYLYAQVVPIDNTPPTVLATRPNANAIDVATVSPVAVTFSELIDASTINGSTFFVNGGGGDVSGLIGTDTVFGKTVATIIPSSPFLPSTTYIATVTVGVEDLAGNPIQQNYVWTFTTGTRPTVISTTPQSGATNVGLGSTVNVTFSELMDTSTITGATFVLTRTGGSVTGAIGFATSSGKTVATLTPSSPLSYSTTYTGTVTNGVKDISGDPMSQNYVWTFTTGSAQDTTPPTVISTMPDTNTAGVLINSQITVTFSEAMDTSSITPNAFILTGGGSNIACSVSASGATATYTPSSQLAYGTVYTATVTTLVKDQAGNNMSTNKTWSFTTELAPSGGGDGGGGGGGGCAVLPMGESDDQSPMGMVLLLTLPAFVLLMRRTFR